VKTSSLLVVSGLVLVSTLLMKASTVEVTPLASIDHTSAGSSSNGHDCGGEPCDAVVRGFGAFFDRELDGLKANGRACADCHMPTDSFQLSPASVEASVSAPPVAAVVESRRRRSAVPADRRG